MLARNDAQDIENWYPRRLTSSRAHAREDHDAAERLERLRARDERLRQREVEQRALAPRAARQQIRLVRREPLAQRIRLLHRDRLYDPAHGRALVVIRIGAVSYTHLRAHETDSY